MALSSAAIGILLVAVAAVAGEEERLFAATAAVLPNRVVELVVFLIRLGAGRVASRVLALGA